MPHRQCHVDPCTGLCERFLVAVYLHDYALILVTGSLVVNITCMIALVTRITVLGAKYRALREEIPPELCRTGAWCPPAA